MVKTVQTQYTFLLGGQVYWRETSCGISLPQWNFTIQNHWPVNSSSDNVTNCWCRQVSEYPETGWHGKVIVQGRGWYVGTILAISGWDGAQPVINVVVKVEADKLSKLWCLGCGDPGHRDPTQKLGWHKPQGHQGCNRHIGPISLSNWKAESSLVKELRDGQSVVTDSQTIKNSDLFMKRGFSLRLDSASDG